MISGSLEIRRDLILADTFVMNSGNLTVGPAIKVDGSMTWSGGGIGGSGTTDLSGGLVFMVLYESSAVILEVVES